MHYVFFFFSPLHHPLSKVDHNLRSLQLYWILTDSHLRFKCDSEGFLVNFGDFWHFQNTFGSRCIIFSVFLRMKNNIFLNWSMLDWIILAYCMFWWKFAVSFLFSSVGLAKAALEAINGFNLFGNQVFDSLTSYTLPPLPNSHWFVSCLTVPPGSRLHYSPFKSPLYIKKVS